ncbi:MAG: hypothetical protein V4509_05455 [Patescibacteria group bacterium]
MSDNNDDSSLIGAGDSEIRIWEGKTDRLGRRIPPQGCFMVGGSVYYQVFSEDPPLGKDGKPLFGAEACQRMLRNMIRLTNSNTSQ